MSDELIRVAASHGKAARMKKGDRLKIINTHGQQVVDFWAFNADDLREFMSMEHARVYLMKIIPKVGDDLVTNIRRPILKLVEDTSPGVHDMLFAACDVTRYKLLGVTGYHRNCQDNFVEALGELGLTAPELPQPLNLFMNVPIKDGYVMDLQPPPCGPGRYVVFEAMMDAVVVMTSCAQDVVPVNGEDCRPRDVHFQIQPPA